MLKNYCSLLWWQRWDFDISFGDISASYFDTELSCPIFVAEVGFGKSDEF